MKRILFCLLLVIAGGVLLFGCKRDSKEPSSARDAVEHGLLPTLAIKGQSLPKMKLTERMSHYNVPGVSIAVINNRALEWAQGYGVVEIGSSHTVTTDTVFQAAAISKLVTAMVVLSFVQSGELELDEKARNVIFDPVFFYVRFPT